jgi:hypothetical protein
MKQMYHLFLLKIFQQKKMSSIVDENKTNADFFKMMILLMTLIYVPLIIAHLYRIYIVNIKDE